MHSDPSRLAIAAVALAGLVSAWWVTSGFDDVRTPAPTVEQVRELGGHLMEAPAQDFALVDLEGRTHTLGSLRGNVVFLNYWATWCPPCREELPSMMRMVAAYSGRPFKLVAVTQDDDRDALDAFLAETGFGGDEVLILLDPDGTIAQSWGTRLLPETYVIDRDGLVVARFMGARDWNSEPARRLFEQLMRPTH